MQVELIATLSHGPTPLAQLAIQVGRGLPTTWTGRRAPDEGHIQTTAQAEAHALELLQKDRRIRNLPALIRDVRLDGVARSHSREMGELGYVGHQSPRTGSPGDRLARAGIPTAAHGENIARESTLHAAQRGLMHSMGHRRNIVNTHTSHVGIGVTPVDAARNRGWIVTQLFARPAHVVDPVRDKIVLLQDLNEARKRARVTPLELAKEHGRIADKAAAGPSRSLRGFMDDWATGGVVEVAGWRLEAMGTRGIPWPGEMLDERWERVTLGVAQKRPDGPLVIVALLQR